MLAALRSNSACSVALLSVVSTMAVFGFIPAHSAEKTLHTFQGGSDGALPLGGLIDGKDGYFYGTAAEGGSSSACQGCGVIFKIVPDGAETVLYAFQGGNDGAEPSGLLLKDSEGNLRGTIRLRHCI
jgi:uncharacterized repeat protein (TIGR03803 family)